MKIVPPGGVVGILGGGQLGRMLSLAAAKLGMDVYIFAPDEDSPASRVSAKTWVAPFDDEVALLEFASQCDVVTLEFENIPTTSLEIIESAGKPVFPKTNALSTSQDRLEEKQFLKSIGVPPADYARVDTVSDLTKALEQFGGQGILKTRRDGYDGKGQVRLSLESDAQAALAKLNGAPAVLEAYVPFKTEISVVIARGQNGDLAFYDPAENDHAGGILRHSTVPAEVSKETVEEAISCAKKLVESLDYVGVLALELFVLEDGRLLANEFAPRVHNSGHWTEAVCPVSQFEQHIRAVCGWPLGPTQRLANVHMDNLLGDSDVARWQAITSKSGLPHLYAKRGGGEGRKLGHANYIIK